MDTPRRDLTAEESAAFVRKLHITLGTEAQMLAVLRLIADSGLGLFVVEKAK